MLILLVALFLPTRHQEYALRVQVGVLDLARVLVGITGRPALASTHPELATERPDERSPERRVAGGKASAA
jgi:hypothetical protein